MKTMKLILMCLIITCTTTFSLQASTETEKEVIYLEIPEEYCASSSDITNGTKVTSCSYIEEIDSYVTTSVITTAEGRIKFEELKISNVGISNTSISNANNFSDCLFEGLVLCSISSGDYQECSDNVLARCWLEAILAGV